MIGIRPFHQHVVHAVHLLSVNPTLVGVPGVVRANGIPVVSHLIKVLCQDPGAHMNTHARIAQIGGANIVGGKLGEPPIVDLHVTMVNGAIGVGIASRWVEAGLHHGN